MTDRPVAAPAPLVVAASLAAVQGLLLVGYAVLELVSIHADRVAMALTTSIFFLAYGLALVACAWGLSRRGSWARSPVVLTQLIQLGLAWSFWGGQTRLVAAGIAVAALVVLAGLFHPASIAALSEDDAVADPR